MSLFEFSSIRSALESNLTKECGEVEDALDGISLEELEVPVLPKEHPGGASGRCFCLWPKESLPKGGLFGSLGG